MDKRGYIAFAAGLITGALLVVIVKRCRHCKHQPEDLAAETKPIVTLK